MKTSFRTSRDLFFSARVDEAINISLIFQVLHFSMLLSELFHEWFHRRKRKKEWQDLRNLLIYIFAMNGGTGTNRPLSRSK
jgi:hypothetical protein